MTTQISPIAASALAGLAVLLSLMFIVLLVRRSRTKKVAAAVPKGNGVTIVLMRGAAPLGQILTGCVFNKGWFTYNADDANPIAIPYDGHFVRSQPQGEPFMLYDIEARCPLAFQGAAGNDEDVTLISHDGTAKDVTAEEAKKYFITQEADQKLGVFAVLRKHASLWKRWPGSRIYAEKTTSDWDIIHSQTSTWLSILNRHMGMLLVIALVLIFIILMVVIF